MDAQVDKNRKNVLIVDSNPKNIALVRSCLKEISPDIGAHEASSESDAFNILSCQKIDILVMDVRLRQGNGMELLRSVPHLDLFHRPAFILVLSDVLAPESSRHSRDHIQFMAKPFDPAQLREYFKSRLGIGPGSPVPPQPKIDIQMFRHFMRGLELVFKTFFGTELKRGRITLRKQEQVRGDVAGRLPLKCRLFEGELVILMDKAPYLAMIRKLFHDEAAALNGGSLDTLAEACNQVFGYAKRELNNLGYGFELALPQTLSEEKAILDPPPPKQVHVLTKFESAVGVVTLEVQIHKILS